ncbi:MAG: oligosaccharide flippase family protein [Candidatus Methylomirabilales bacterium]
MVWSLAGYGWPLLLSFIATPFIVTRLGEQLFGIYVLSGFVLTYFAFVEFGLGAAATKYIAEHRAEGNTPGIVETFWTGLAWVGGAGAVAVAVVLPLAHPLVVGPLRLPPALQSTAAHAVAISAGMFAAVLGCSLTTGTLRAFGRFSALNRSSMLVGTAQIGSTVGLLWLGGSIQVVMLAQALCHLALFLWQFRLCLRTFPALRAPRVTRATLARLLRYGLGPTGMSFTGPLLAHVDKLLLTRYASIGLLTYYAVPFSLVERLGLIPSAFGAVLFPSYSFHGLKSPDISRDLHYRGTLYIAVAYGFFASFLVALGQPFLTAWLGAEFGARSGRILAILAGASTLSAMARPAVTALQGLGHPALPLLFHAVELPFYVPAAFYAVRAYGLEGAAWAFAFRVALDAALLHGASASALGQPLGAYLRLLRVAVPPLAACTAAFWLIRLWDMPLTSPTVLLLLSGTGLGYVLLLWVSVLDGSTRALLRSSLSQAGATGFWWDGGSDGMTVRKGPDR